MKTPHPHLAFPLTAILLATTLPHAASAQGEGQPALLQQYGDWGVYTGLSSGNKVCFALSQPSSAETNPPNRPRDPVYFMVSHRPADNIRNEVSVIVGYPFRPNSEATAEIGNASFSMQTQRDNAWIKSTADESRMIEAMRKGSDIVVKGVSGRGTQSTDRYSLKGVSQALDRAAQECR